MWWREEFTERVKMGGISMILNLTVKIKSLTYALSRLIKDWYVVSISKQNSLSHFCSHPNLIFKQSHLMELDITESISILITNLSALTMCKTWSRAVEDMSIAMLDTTLTKIKHNLQSYQTKVDLWMIKILENARISKSTLIKIKILISKYFMIKILIMDKNKRKNYCR